MMGKTQFKRRAKKHHKKTRRMRKRRGGTGEKAVAHEMTELLDSDAQKDAESYINLIDQFIKNNETDPSFKYVMMKDNLLVEYQSIKSKNTKELTYGDLAKLINIEYIIIKDDVDESSLYFDKNIANFQYLLKNILLYFVNDIPIEDIITLRNRKRIIDNKAYFEVDHTKTGEETIAQVNELLALLKNELRVAKHQDPKSTILKTTTIKNNRKVEEIPQKSPKTD